MVINTKDIVSITEANQNFSKVARMADESGSVVIMKNNAPRYILIRYNKIEDGEATPDADALAISKRLLEQNREAYEALAE